jgi:hypothetical protein
MTVPVICLLQMIEGLHQHWPVSPTIGSGRQRRFQQGFAVMLQIAIKVVMEGP